MDRLLDPELFPNDIIADYFQAIVPSGYRLFYQYFIQLGWEPSAIAKTLPLGLGLIATIYCFGVSLSLFKFPAVAFLTTLIVNQSLWLKDDLISASPRAFLYPLFFSFLYYLLKRSLLPCLITIALQGLFYPQFVLVDLAILAVRLLHWHSGKLQRSKNRLDYLFWLAGGAIALIVLLPFALETSSLGPVVTAEQAQVMPEFGPDGRSRFFVNNPFEFWIAGDSGIRPPSQPWIIWISVLLPLFLKSSSPLNQRISHHIVILPQILVASLGLFGLAHGVFLKLHLPSRYTEHTLRVVMALAAGIVLSFLLEAGLRWLRQRPWKLIRGSSLVGGCLSLAIAALVTIPLLPPVFLEAQGHVIGQFPQLYEFLRQQPKDVMIASLTGETDNLPTFAKRSVLVSREYGIPYHPSYYNQIRQRAIDLVRAEYSPTIAAAQNLIQTYGVDFFLLDRGALNPKYIQGSDWITQFEPAATEALTYVEQGQTPALYQLINQCSVLEVQSLVLLPAECVLGATSP